MMLARLACNVDTSCQDERAADRRERVQRLAPGQGADGDRDERLGEREDRGARGADPLEADRRTRCR